MLEIAAFAIEQMPTVEMAEIYVEFVLTSFGPIIQVSDHEMNCVLVNA